MDRGQNKGTVNTNVHKNKSVAIYLLLLLLRNQPKIMQSMLNIRANHGVPLCLSGIIHPLALSLEIADHDRRRKAMRRQRSLTGEGIHANQEMGRQISFERRNFVEFKGEIDGDLDDILHDLALTATAA